jgi:hypothetical protein
MTLVIENGTNVANANSYTTLAEIRAYALARGVTLPAVDATLEIAAIKAMDYLESIRAQYQGLKTYSTQALQWPRTGVWIDNVEFPSTSIPKLLKDAQCQLCIELNNGIDIMPTSTGYGIKREKVDLIETEYDVNIGTSISYMRAVVALLDPLLKVFKGFSLSALRV